MCVVVFQQHFTEMMMRLNLQKQTQTNKNNILCTSLCKSLFLIVCQMHAFWRAGWPIADRKLHGI